MPDGGFPALFRAIERIRQQVSTADTELKTYLQEELTGLRNIGVQYLDQWLALDEQIHELELVLQQHSPTSVPGQYGPLQIRTTPLSPLSADSIQLESMLFDETNRAEISLRKGMAYYELLMFDQASTSLEEAVQQIDLPATRLYLAAAYAAQNNVEAALYHISQVRATSDQPQILCATWEIEAHVHLLQQNVEGAIRCYLDIIAIAPSYEDAWYNLGLCHLATDEPIAAERVFWQAARRNPEDAETRLWLAYAKYQQNAYDEAYATCSEAVKQFPRHYGLLTLLSSICKPLGRFDVGEAISRRMVRLAPERPDGYLHTAWYLLQQHDAGGAVAILKKLICLCPTNAQAITLLGVACLQAKQETRAERLLQTVTNPVPTIASLALGRIAALRGDYKQAYQYLTPGLKSPLRPFKRLALYYYGCCLMEENKLREAETYMRAADVMGEPNSAILHALKDITSALGQSGESVRCEEQTPTHETIKQTT